MGGMVELVLMASGDSGGSVGSKYFPQRLGNSHTTSPSCPRKAGPSAPLLLMWQIGS